MFETMLDKTNFKKGIIPWCSFKDVFSWYYFWMHFFFSFSPVPPEKLVTNGVLVVILNYCSSVSVFMIAIGMVNLAGAPTPHYRWGEGEGDGGQTGSHPVVLLPVGGCLRKECAQSFGMPRDLFTTTGWYQVCWQSLKWSFTDLLLLCCAFGELLLWLPHSHPVFPTSTGWYGSCFLGCP